MTANQGYTAVPEILSDANDKSIAAQTHRRQIARALNGALRGNINCTLDVVVTAGATSTTITDPRISYFSFLSTMAFDANGAADEVAGIYFDTFKNGSAVMHHRNNGSTRSLRILILG